MTDKESYAVIDSSGHCVAFQPYNPMDKIEQLEQENTRLKKEIKNNKAEYQCELGTYNMECGNLLEENKSLLQTLSKIKEIAEELTKAYSYDPDIDIILQKISEVEEE